MSAKDTIKAELQNLIAEGRKLPLSIKDDSVLEFGRKYQAWYTKTLKVISVLAPDRLEEFRSYYNVDPKRKTINVSTYRIQDFIRGFSPTMERWDHHNLTQIMVVNQLHILESVESRIEGVLADIEATLIASFQDVELSTAESLKKVSLRASGALAGVILEEHLQRVIDNHSIKLGKKNPTISDMNDPLRNAGVYDTPTWRRIQYLADIRNLCSHKKSQDPTLTQIDELIAGVNWTIKNII